MKIDRIELRNIRMDLVSPFETSFGVQTFRNVLLLTVFSEGLAGWGECVAGKDPFYSSETPTTCKYILNDYLIPALLSGRISGDPTICHFEADFVRGHSMAKAALESALWDIAAQKSGKPLHEMFGGTRSQLFTGVSVGIQKSVDKLVDVVGGYIEEGYRRIKIKIKPGWDISPVAAIKNAYPDAPLMVDANCAYSISDLDILQELDQYQLMMIEQPFHYYDLIDHARLQDQIKTPVCLDESATSLQQVMAAVKMGSCKLVNIKQGRVGGASQAMAIHDYCQDAKIGVWAGGMLETGIGRALNIALASLENFSIPGDISASNRYWHKDIIVPEVTVSKDGKIAVPQNTGIGFEPNLKMIERITESLTVIKG